MDKTPYRMNLPAGLKGWLASEATKNERSLSGQIIFLLKGKMEAAEGQPEQLTSAASEQIDVHENVNSNTQGHQGASNEFTK